jgi:mono/diheme cytochrome c family protein
VFAALWRSPDRRSSILAVHPLIALRALGAGAALALLVACAGQNPPSATAGASATAPPSGTPADATIKAVSFKTDVAPMLASSCAGCHAVGKEGDRDMLLFDDANAVAYATAKDRIRDIVNQVKSGRMPRGRAHLSAEQVALLQAWQSAGMPDN